jgi:hypothetical protein
LLHEGDTAAILRTQNFEGQLGTHLLSISQISRNQKEEEEEEK